MDLGSAVLSAELALDLLADPTIRDRVTLSPAPIVEGLIVAAVAAAGGASRAEVAAEARDALMGKAAHLSAPADDARRRARRPSSRRGRRRLHRREPARPARPAGRPPGQRGARPRRHRSQLRNLTTGAGPVPAGSLSRVATLAPCRATRSRCARPGRRRRRRSSTCSRWPRAGSTNRRAERPVEDLAPRAPIASTGSGPLPASPGIAIGPVRRLTAAPVDLDDGDGGRAGRGVATDRRGGRRRAPGDRARPGPDRREVGAEEASIFDAHLSLLADAEMLADVKARIGTGVGAVAAWAGCLAEVERAVGRAARPLPARAGRGRPRGRRPGAAGPDRRVRAGRRWPKGSWSPAT